MPTPVPSPAFTASRPQRTGPGAAADRAEPPAESDAPALWSPEPAPLPVGPPAPALPGPRAWTVFGDESPAARSISAEICAGLSGIGTFAALPAELDPRAVRTLIKAVRHALRGPGRLVVLHHGAGGVSLLRTLRTEMPWLSCVTIATETTRAALATARVLAAAPPPGVAEVSVDRDGLASTTAWVPVRFPGTRAPLRPGDHVVVSGGLGGLGSEIAEMLIRRFDVHPLILDAADPYDAAEPAADALRRLRAAGPVSYSVVDVTDPCAVRAALGSMAAGRPVTAVVHCAGVIKGGAVAAMSERDLAELAAPKVAGLRAIVAPLDRRRLRMVLAFGSILARVPHPGVGAYALANEMLRREVERLTARLPGPRYLTAEWSIWDGAGVAARTGAVNVARRTGYVPIRLADGLAMVERLLGWRGPQTSLVISSTSPDSTGAAAPHRQRSQP